MAKYFVFVRQIGKERYEVYLENIRRVAYNLSLAPEFHATRAKDVIVIDTPLEKGQMLCNPSFKLAFRQFERVVRMVYVKEIEPFRSQVGRPKKR